MDDNFENLKLVTYPYPKYGETVLAIKLDKGNLQIADLSKVFTENNSLAEYEKTREQAEGLGKRIVLCVNSYDDLQQQVRELEAAKAELQAENERLKGTTTQGLLKASVIHNQYLQAKLDKEVEQFLKEVKK